MPGPGRLVAQLVLYGLFAAVIGIFSHAPSHTHFPPGQALIKLSFSHPAQRKGACRRLTRAEIQALAPNMRRTRDCPRERLPVLVEMDLDGALLHRELLAPTGLWSDGASSIYRRFPVAAGRHRLAVRLRDSARPTGFDYSHAADIDLAPGRNFVVDFRAEAGGFILR